MVFWYDHLFIFVSMIIFPLIGYLRYQSILEKLQSDQGFNRIKIYLGTIYTQWSLALFCLVLWWYSSRTWPQLGFSTQFSNTWWIAAIAVVLVIVLLTVQLFSVSSLSEKASKQIFTQVKQQLPFMPTNSKEASYFNLLGLTAGIVEELLWRGYLIWYLSHYVNYWQALLISLLAFTLAHSYQGVSQLYKVGLVGGLLTGVIWFKRKSMAGYSAAYRN